MVAMAQRVGQQDSEAVVTGSNPSFYLHFLNLIITTENRDTAPSYTWKVSIPEIFWNQEGFPYEKFRYWDRKFSTENRDIPLLRNKIFDTRN